MDIDQEHELKAGDKPAVPVGGMQEFLEAFRKHPNFAWSKINHGFWEALGKVETRFGSNLQVKINVKDEFMNQLVLPMSLQILVENAVKHNIISKNKNLIVDIFVANNCLVVSNNLQLRTVEEGSTKIGLKNIENRYKYFTNESVIIESDIKFIVKLPLLKIDS